MNMKQPKVYNNLAIIYYQTDLIRSTRVFWILT